MNQAEERPFVIERVSGMGALFLRLSGRIDDRFDPEALGTLEGPIALDLSGIRAITSFGVRHLTETMRAAPPGSMIYLLECPPCIVDQLNVVHGFLGTAEVLSARALFACTCGAEDERSVDVLGDGARMRAGRPPYVVCASCGEEMRLVEDDTFRFVANRGAKKLDERVGKMLTELGLYLPTTLELRPLTVRKIVDGGGVVLKLDGAIGESSRLERIAEEDGIVALVVRNLSVSGNSLESLARFLAAIEEAAREVVLVDVPPNLALLFGNGALSIGRVKIDSLLVLVRCSSCAKFSTSTSKLHEPEVQLRCTICGRGATPVTVRLDRDRLRAAGPPTQEARLVLDRIDSLFSGAAVEERLIAHAKKDPTGADLPKQIGNYKILRPLSAGGMAEVLVAKRESMGGVEKLVALKRFRRELFQSAPAAIEMFLSEARLAAQLSHPNVVQIFDVGETDGDLYMAMELVDGRDLRELVDLGVPLPPQIVAHLGLEIARALAYLHDARDLRGRVLRIVHRDVSPQNVLVDRNGRVVLIDFGVALAGEGELQKRRRKVAGNLAYMSPEQCHGEPLDGRSDLYSLGVTLWELLAAAPLFRRENANETRAALLSGEVPPLAGLPAPFDKLLKRLLDRDPKRRPPSANEVARELDALLPSLGGHLTPGALASFIEVAMKNGEAKPAPAPVVGTAPRPRAHLLAFTAIVVAMAGIAIWLLTR